MSTAREKNVYENHYANYGNSTEKIKARKQLENIFKILKEK